MKLKNRIKEIRFNWKHLIFIFLSLIVFQIFISRMQQNTLRDLLSDTMDWYKQNSAEQIGNLTASSLEVILETDPVQNKEDKAGIRKNIIHALNSTLKQPLMKRNVEEICIILPYKENFIALDIGQKIFSYFFEHQLVDTLNQSEYSKAVAHYASLHAEMMKSELITSFQEEQNIIHVYVPLVPHGEYAGAVYLKIRPDISSISQQILVSFNNTVLLFSSLILLGLLAIFYISTFILIERDEAWALLYKEREVHLLEQIAQRKEHLFTKRIYNTHHKAEKVMGFINEDVDRVNELNIKEIKYRIAKYANFISRVIYDMKWYNPPLYTIRNPIFKTNINEVVRFIVNNIFLRISHPVKSIDFDFRLDDSLPPVSVNEFVVWEVIEPIIQNAIEHSNTDIVRVTITSRYSEKERKSYVIIEDDGKGIRPDLLEKNESGIKRIFLENISTKEEDKNCGYGCYLAYEISKRCGWEIDAENNNRGGGKFTILINN